MQGGERWASGASNPPWSRLPIGATWRLIRDSFDRTLCTRFFRLDAMYARVWRLHHVELVAENLLIAR